MLLNTWIFLKYGVKVLLNTVPRCLCCQGVKYGVRCASVDDVAVVDVVTVADGAKCIRIIK